MWYWITFVAVVWLLFLVALVGLCVLIAVLGRFRAPARFRDSARRELQWRQLEFEQKKERIAQGRRRR